MARNTWSEPSAVPSQWEPPEGSTASKLSVHHQVPALSLQCLGSSKWRHYMLVHTFCFRHINIFLVGVLLIPCFYQQCSFRIMATKCTAVRYALKSYSVLVFVTTVSLQDSHS